MFLNLNLLWFELSRQCLMFECGFRGLFWRRFRFNYQFFELIISDAQDQNVFGMAAIADPLFRVSENDTSFYDDSTLLKRKFFTDHIRMVLEMILVGEAPWQSMLTLWSWFGLLDLVDWWWFLTNPGRHKLDLKQEAVLS